MLREMPTSPVTWPSALRSGTFSGDGFRHFDHPEHGFARGQEVLFVRKFLPRVERRKEIHVAFADRFIWNCQAQVGGVCAVDAREPGLAVFEIDEIRQIIHERLQKVPFVCEFGFELLALGNIVLDRHEIPNVPPLV
jgi:hypothetical protein